MLPWATPGSETDPCCCTVKCVTAEFTKFGYDAFDGSGKKYLHQVFVDDGDEECGVGTIVCEYDNCGNLNIVSAIPGPSGEGSCTQPTCPGGTPTVSGPTQLDVACPPDGCGDDHVTLSSEFTTSALEAKVDALLAAVDFGDLEENGCAYPYYTGETCETIEPNISTSCGCEPIAFFYTDNETLDDATLYIQKRKIAFVASVETYCLNTYDMSGTLLSSSDLSTTPETEYEIDPPSAPGWIEVVPGECP